MAENKTKPTEASVEAHLAGVATEAQRLDCERLTTLMSRLTGQRPKMWGPSIVGFGSYHYTYESGRQGDACLTGFAVRKNELAIYLTASGPAQEGLLKQLGKHKMGKACLMVRRLDALDMPVLEALIKDAIDETKRRYP